MEERECARMLPFSRSIADNIMTHRLKMNALILPLLLCAPTAGISANGIDPAEFRSRRQAYAARTTDGGSLRVRMLGSDAAGRWYPLSGAGHSADLDCAETRVYELRPDAPPLVRLQIDLEAEALSSTILVNEIWAEAFGPGAS